MRFRAGNSHLSQMKLQYRTRRLSLVVDVSEWCRIANGLSDGPCCTLRVVVEVEVCVAVLEHGARTLFERRLLDIVAIDLSKN